MSHPYGNLTIAEVKTWMQNLLTTSDKAVERALVVIFERQTADEQMIGVTRVNNAVGFSGVDAELCTSFAKQVIKRGSLSPKQMVYARKKMLKYWKQLADIAYANGKIPNQSVEVNVEVPATTRYGMLNNRTSPPSDYMTRYLRDFAGETI